MYMPLSDCDSEFSWHFASHTAIQLLSDAWVITVHESTPAYSHRKNRSRENFHSATGQIVAVHVNTVSDCTFLPACLRYQMVGFVQVDMLYIQSQTLYREWMKGATEPE